MRQASINLEDATDIESDVMFLTEFHGVISMKTFSKALINSQLFEVPLKRHKHQLHTLAEFAALSKHNNPFVCFHDEGFLCKIIIICIMYIRR